MPYFAVRTTQGYYVNYLVLPAQNFECDNELVNWTTRGNIREYLADALDRAPSEEEIDEVIRRLGKCDRTEEDEFVVSIVNDRQPGGDCYDPEEPQFLTRQGESTAGAL